MSRTIVRPHELDLTSPGRRDYFVALEHDSIWGDHLIPLTVAVGPEAAEGRGMVAFGSTHGNEYEGPVAIKHMMAGLDMAAVRGRLILVPVLNPAAFRAGARDSVADDGVNLNRAFVEGAGRVPLSGITHRIARFVRESIWPHVHIVLDLHAGGEVGRFAPGPSYHACEDPEQDRLTETIARWFGTRIVIVYQNETPGLLTSEAERLGKVTLGAELGWGAAVEATGVAHARQGLRAAAILGGQMHGTLQPIAHHAAGDQVKAEMIDRACFTPTPVSGLYEPVVPCGALVSAGDVIGLVHDFERIDAPAWEARAGVEGIVICEAWGARVRQGQHVAVTGRIRPFNH